MFTDRFVTELLEQLKEDGLELIGRENNRLRLATVEFHFVLWKSKNGVTAKVVPPPDLPNFRDVYGLFRTAKSHVERIGTFNAHSVASAIRLALPKFRADGERIARIRETVAARQTLIEAAEELLGEPCVEGKIVTDFLAPFTVKVAFNPRRHQDVFSVNLRWLTLEQLRQVIDAVRLE